MASAGLNSPSAPGGAAASGANAAGPGTNASQQLPGTAASLLLDGDGILTQLFYFLWRMKCSAVVAAGGNTVTYSRKPLRSDDPATQAVLDLCIPSTVILEHNFPKIWYARSGDFDEDDVGASRSSTLSSAPLERRTGRDIDSAAIIRAFRVPEGGSAAQTPASGDVVASYYAEATDDEGRACTRIEFLDVEGVKGLLIRRTRRPDGILQCWVSPCGKENSVVQVIWSPHVMHVTKRRNRFPLRDTRLPLYDRSVTFEGLAHYSEETFIAPHVHQQTKFVCEELVRHFRDVHRVMVQRMVLYFKCDTAGRLWFLFGNSLRVAERRPISLTLRGMKPQERIDAENAHSSRIARMLVDEAYEVKVSRQSRTPVQKYAAAHKALRDAAKDEPLIRSLIGAQVPPYATLRARPPSLGPIGETYYQQPRRSGGRGSGQPRGGASGGGGGAGGDHSANDIDGGGTAAAAAGGVSFASAHGSVGVAGGGGGADDAVTSPNNNNNNASPSTHAGTALAPDSAAKKASLSRLVGKLRSAAMIGTASVPSPSSSPSRLLASSLGCVVPPPTHGTLGTLGGGSLAMFGGTPAVVAAASDHNQTTAPGNRPGPVLWQIVRLALACGAIRTVALRRELREFVKSVMYALYSHFAYHPASAVAAYSSASSSARGGGGGGAHRPFRVVVPRTYFVALGDAWWANLGFANTRAVRVADLASIVPPPRPPSQPAATRDAATRDAEPASAAAAAAAASAMASAAASDCGSPLSPEVDDVAEVAVPPHVLDATRSGAAPESAVASHQHSPAGRSPVTSAEPQDRAAAFSTMPGTTADGGEGGGDDGDDLDEDQLRERDARRLEEQQRLNLRARQLLSVPLSSQPDDVVLEVGALAAPLLHVQAQLERLIRARIELPAAKVHFFYAAHRVIMDRRKARKFAAVVRQSWVRHRVDPPLSPTLNASP